MEVHVVRGRVIGGRLAAAAAIAAMATTVTACGESSPDRAGAPGEQTSSSQPMSTTPPPTQGSPTKPPTTPSDPQPHALVAGRVVRGGAGPCYGLETDDGELYAVHSTSVGELAVGTTVRVKIAPRAADVDCGEGKPVTALRIEIVG